MFKPSKKTMQLKESENIFKFSKNGTLQRGAAQISQLGSNTMKMNLLVLFILN